MFSDDAKAGGPDSDWGCVGPEELFDTCGPTPSLLSLVARIECRERMGRISKPGPLYSGGSLTVEANGPKMEADDEQHIVSHAATTTDVVANLRPVVAAPKILKKNATGTPQRGPNLKKVAFEVERFVAANLADRDERQTAEQRLVISLGAKPPRRKPTNYRMMKEQRAEAKRKATEEREQQGSGLGALLRSVKGGGKVRKPKGRKRKNGSGVLKKQKREQKMHGKKKKIKPID